MPGLSLTLDHRHRIVLTLDDGREVEIALSEARSARRTRLRLIAPPEITIRRRERGDQKKMKEAE